MYSWKWISEQEKLAAFLFREYPVCHSGKHSYDVMLSTIVGCIQGPQKMQQFGFQPSCLQKHEKNVFLWYFAIL